MKILISNDDGVHANGIDFLYTRLEQTHDVTMIAPDRERSSCGHGITLGEPLRLKKVQEKRYSCSGLPADCILMGIGHVMKDDRPDVVVSGINHGANLGQDCYYSGTVAAAREAVFRSIPGIAVSLVTLSLKDVEHFDVAAEFCHQLLEKGIHKILPPRTLLNINVPNLPWEKIAGVRLCTLGLQKYSEDVIGRLDRYGKNYYWVGGTYSGYEDIPGSDCEAVHQGLISVSLVDLCGHNYQDNEVLQKLKNILEGYDDKKDFSSHNF